MNEANVLFSSEFGIEKQVQRINGSGSGDFLAYSFTGNPPTYQVMFRPTGMTEWYTEGDNIIYTGEFAGTFNLYSYVSGSTIRIRSLYSTNVVFMQPRATDFRLYIWEDKIF